MSRTEIDGPYINNVTLENTETESKKTQTIEDDDLRVEMLRDTFHSVEEGENVKNSLEDKELVNVLIDHRNDMRSPGQMSMWRE